jgi:hypothetical protein
LVTGGRKQPRCASAGRGLGVADKAAAGSRRGKPCPYQRMEKSGDGSGGSCAEILIGGVFGPGVESIVEGMRDVDDDLLWFLGESGFEGDGAVGVEELVGDIGEDRGAAWGDAAFGDEGEEAAEELADVDCRRRIRRVVLDGHGNGNGETFGGVAAAKARVSG